MKIDIHNYESFFLDFVEGRLDDASTLEMLNFLRKHPDLKQELEGFGDVRLDPDDISFPSKNLLKKLDFKGAPVNDNNFNDFAIAHHEKILSVKETEKLFRYLEQNPHKNNDFKMFGTVYLKADPAIVFEAKPFLKKRPKGTVRAIVLRFTAVAAGVAIAVAVFYKSPDKQNLPVNQTRNEIIVSQVEEETTKRVTKINLPQKTKREVISTTGAINVNQGTVEQGVIVREKNIAALEPIKAVYVEGDYVVNRPELVSNTVNPPALDGYHDLDVLDYAGKVIRERVLKGSDGEKTTRRISLWDLADITLKGYNRIAEKDIVIHRKTDEDGKITAIAIETETKKYGFENKN